MSSRFSSTTLTRRHFLMGAAAAGAVSAQPQSRPNVLFIASDDLNRSFSAYGNPLVPTPNLDSIAQRGVRFACAYCQFPLCNPSRTSVMTGLAPDATRVYDLVKHFRSTVPNVVTLGQAFQRNGYFSGRVGKIYHQTPPDQIGTNGLDDAPTWNMRVNPKGVDRTQEERFVTNYNPGKPLSNAVAFYASHADDAAHTDGLVASETIRLMEEHPGQPWFLAAGFYRPHCPYIAPSKYFDMVPLNLMKLIPLQPNEMQIAPPWAYRPTPANLGMTPQQRLEGMRAYYASVLFLDAQVGKLLSALKRLRQESNTLIVFWGDHGYGLGEHGQWMKETIFEYSAGAPLMICGPGVAAQGMTCNRTVEFLDIYPTLVDLCDLSNVPEGLHGRSLRGLLENPLSYWDRPAVTQIHRVVQGATIRGYSMRTEQYRYTMWNNGNAGEELYDYENDPQELKNLASEFRVSFLKWEMKSRLQNIIASRQA